MCSRCSARRAAHPPPGARHRRRVRGAHRAQGPAARADLELQPGLGGRGRPRRRAGRHVPRAPDLPAREPRHHRRADRVRARHEPAGDQLRPAARQLSPTLVDLDRLAPDLRGFFEDLEPARARRSRGACPPPRAVLDNTRPILARLDPFLRQLTPIIDYLGLYRREIAAFFANDSAATQALGPGFSSSGPVHYLRVMNPLNPEIMAGYPNRLATSRSNPYTQPGAYDRLARGEPLPVFGSYLCTSNPTPPPPAPNAVSVRPAGGGDPEVRVRHRHRERGPGAAVRGAGPARRHHRPGGPLPGLAAPSVGRTVS